MRKFLTRPLSKVVLAWGASSAIDHVVDVQHLKKDYRGNCCVLRPDADTWPSSLTQPSWKSFSISITLT